jgi:hypothetical protein
MIEIPEVAVKVVVDIVGVEVEEVAEVTLVAVGAGWERELEREANFKARQEGKSPMYE